MNSIERTVAGTIYWPLYSFNVLKSEILPTIESISTSASGIRCPYLYIEGTTSKCSLNNSNCKEDGLCNNYDKYHSHFLLLDQLTGLRERPTQELVFSDNKAYKDAYQEDTSNLEDSIDILSYFPQNFNDKLQIKNVLIKMKPGLFFEKWKGSPMPLEEKTYVNEEAVFVGSEYLLFKRMDDANLPDKAFHRLVNLDPVKESLPSENFSSQEDALLGIRLSFFADSKIDAMLSLVVRSEDGWDKNNGKYTAQTTKLLSLIGQALGSINNDLFRERKDFLFSWCCRLEERVSNLYQDKQADLGDNDAKEEALTFSKDATQMMCDTLAATENANLSIDYDNHQWVLTEPQPVLRNNRKDYINHFLHEAHTQTFAALAIDSKLKGRLSAPAALEIHKIAKKDDPLRARILLRGEAGGGKGVAAEDFHASCMKRIADNDTMKTDYLNCTKKTLGLIMKLPPIYLSGVDPKRDCDFFRRQVNGTGWWQWFESEDDTSDFRKAITKEEIIKAFSDLIEKKLLLESSKGSEANWTFNLFQINCGILGGQGSELIDSLKRLFGIGSDVLTSSPGIFQTCSYVGGTLFLDEIADAPIRIQDNLLRPLEEGSVSRLGWETYNEKVKDIRIVGATFKDLFKLSKQFQETLPSGNPKGFRPDLLTRLTRNPPVTINPIWQYFLPKSDLDFNDHPLQFSFVLEAAFGADRKFWRDVYYKVACKLDEYDRMAKHHIPDDIDRRKYYASKLTMRLFKHVGNLAEDETKRNNLLADYLPRMLDYLLSDS